MPKTEQDIITLKDDFVEIISKSGSKYEVTLERCSCVGYGFRGACRHFKMAEESGFLDQLKTKIANLDFRKIPSVRETRIDAIKQYLAKNKLEVSSEVIEFLNEKISRDTKPQEFFEMVSNYGA